MRIVGKTSIVLSAILIQSVAHADCNCDWYHDPNYSWETAYIGIMAGGGVANETVKLISPFATDSTSLDHRFATGGISFGFATSEDRWYMGAEANTLPAFINTSKTWVGNSGVTYNSKITLINYANFDALPGYFITNNILFYLRAGVGVAQDKLKENNFFGANYNLEDTTYGPQVGAGFDYSFNPQISAGLDYIYTDFVQSSFSQTASNIAADGATYTFRIKANDSVVSLHLRYNFLV